MSTRAVLALADGTIFHGTAFGARTILERIKEYGVPVNRIVCAGGIAEKNPMLMQIYADITGCDLGDVDDLMGVTWALELDHPDH